MHTLEGARETEPFFSITGVAVDADHNIYVLDGGNASLMAFDAAGTLIWREGREGPGPEEFANPNHLTWVHDTLATWDLGNNRISFWTTDGQQVGIVGLGEVAFPAHPVRVAPLAGRHIIIATVLPGFSPAAPPAQLEGAVVTARLGATRMDTLATFIDAGPVLLRSPEGPQLVFQPYIPFPSFTALADGHAVLTMGAEYVISIIAPTGRSETTFRGPAIRAPVTSGAREEFVSDVLHDPGTADQLDWPEEFPAIAGLATAGKRSILVKTYWSSNDLVRWDRWDLDGTFLYSVLLPDNLDKIAATGAYIVGRTTDELGVQRVETFEIGGNTGCPGPQPKS